MTSHATSSRITLAARQQQLRHLPAGTELRCLRGALMVQPAPGSGQPAHQLAAHQALRLDVAQWVAMDTQDGALLCVCEPASAIRPTAPSPCSSEENAVRAGAGRPQKSRQGPGGLWRLSLLRWWLALRRARRAV